MSRITTVAIGAAMALALGAASAGAQDYPKPADPADGRLPRRRLDRHRRPHRRVDRREGAWASRSSSSTRAAPAARWAGPNRAPEAGRLLHRLHQPAATNTVILDPERKAIFTEKDFTPIINQVLDPGVIWVKADSPYKTLQDLIDAAKKAPTPSAPPPPASCPTTTWRS